MAISPERRQYIADLANDEWVDRIDPSVNEAGFEELGRKMEQETDTFLRTVQSPWELHLFADLWNWDCGPGRLHEIAMHPLCDAGTALMMYWRARPEYYLKYQSSDDVPEHKRDMLDLIRTIEERFQGNAYKTRSIPYDPREQGEVGHYGGPETWKRTLPSEMYEPVELNRSR